MLPIYRLKLTILYYYVHIYYFMMYTGRKQNYFDKNICIIILAVHTWTVFFINEKSLLCS